MVQEKRLLKDLVCKTQKNQDEIDYWKVLFIEKKPIPQPIINKQNRIIAFASCFYVLEELGLEEIWCTIKEE